MRGYHIDPLYQNFVEQELLPGLKVSREQYWQTFAKLLESMQPRNQALLDKRHNLQAQIDTWHQENPAPDPTAYQDFLRSIGYLMTEGDDFNIETTNIDPEISTVAGPQLVVPISNARYVLNAVNARYGSLYDALYGTDALPKSRAASGTELDPMRASQVIVYCRDWLDRIFPLKKGSHHDAQQYRVQDAQLIVTNTQGNTSLQDNTALVGYQGEAQSPSTLILRHHGLHVVIRIDAEHAIGRTDHAHISDIVVESALSTIVDLEDSIAAVDAEDKVHAYRHWLQLMQQSLQTQFSKSEKTVTRRIAADEEFITPNGDQATLRKRALLWLRNVGHLMTTPICTDSMGQEVGEGLIDAITSVAAGMHDILSHQQNSVAGSIYIVKPKMHGPEEVAFTNDIFSLIEENFDLPRYTVKIGIMDEERRTSANLKECIRAARHRVAFINTGFLDRTGDEIHTSMQAGVSPPKSDLKKKIWIKAYEDRNVDIGLACGLHGKAQIGKGMWAMPDLMADMMQAKIEHPQAGANCAWIPSPTAATLHALHYHDVDVMAIQRGLLENIAQNGIRAGLDALLDIPLLHRRNLSPEDIQQEAENNAQGILGYVVRWVDMGIGCSKVPDINNVGLMEDRATCRISSQILTNWWHHGLLSKDEVMQVMQRMAMIVDEQNKNDPNYTPMAPDYNGFAFKAACALVFEGISAPSGYTEPALHTYRQKQKSL